jgi:hypothetical protein
MQIRRNERLPKSSNNTCVYHRHSGKCEHREKIILGRWRWPSSTKQANTQFAFTSVLLKWKCVCVVVRASLCQSTGREGDKWCRGFQVLLATI